jgi:3-methyladenine DNA glycosylase AlkD
VQPARRHPARVDAGDVVARLRAAYEPEADPIRAVGTAAYMRHQFAFFGMLTSDRRRLARQALEGLPGPSEQELAAVARALWGEPEREFQHTACDYLRAHIAVAGPSFVVVVRELVVTKSWWDTVDPLAAHVAGPLVHRHPELVATMDAWVTDDDIWLARAAILHQLAYKEATDPGRLFRYCAQRAADPEFFLRKAIGWALRQYAAIDPEAVDAFVAATPELSALSVREAMKGVRRARR